MIEDRVVVGGTHFNIITSENGIGIFTVIYTETSHECTIIKQYAQELNEREEKDMALKNLHEKFLSILFRTIKKSKGTKIKDIEINTDKYVEKQHGKKIIHDEKINKNFSSDNNRNINENIRDRDTVEKTEETIDTFQDQLLNFCKDHIGESVTMCLITDGDSVVIHYKSDLNRGLNEKLQNEILKIMEVADQNRDGIDRMIGGYREILFASGEHNFFYHALQRGLVSVLVTPGGQLGRYAKEVERFNSKLEAEFGAEEQV